MLSTLLPASSSKKYLVVGPIAVGAVLGGYASSIPSSSWYFGYVCMIACLNARGGFHAVLVNTGIWVMIAMGVTILGGL